MRTPDDATAVLHPQARGERSEHIAADVGYTRVTLWSAFPRRRRPVGLGRSKRDGRTAHWRPPDPSLPATDGRRAGGGVAELGPPTPPQGKTEYSLGPPGCDAKEISGSCGSFVSGSSFRSRLPQEHPLHGHAHTRGRLH